MSQRNAIVPVYAALPSPRQPREHVVLIESEPIRVLSKVCAVCGTSFTKPSKSTWAGWENQKYCGRPCSLKVARSYKSPRRTIQCAICGKTIPVRSVGQVICKKKSCRSKRLTQIARAKRKISRPTQTKKCVLCCHKFRRRMKESASGFKIRQTCGKKCRYELASIVRVKPTRDKQCKICGATIKRKPKQSYEVFNRQAVCSTGCSAKLGARRKHDRALAEMPLRWCPICGSAFKAKKAYNKTDRWQQYCRLKCAYQAQILHALNRKLEAIRFRSYGSDRMYLEHGESQGCLHLLAEIVGQELATKVIMDEITIDSVLPEPDAVSDVSDLQECELTHLPGRREFSESV